MSGTIPLARRQTLFIGVFLVVVVLFVTNYCMGVVRGSSMEPTYQDSQVVLVRRRTPLNAKLHRNDVVLLQRDRGEVIIKRIFRLPGEEVSPGYPGLVGFRRTARVERLLRTVDRQVRPCACHAFLRAAGLHRSTRRQSGCLGGQPRFRAGTDLQRHRHRSRRAWSPASRPGPAHRPAAGHDAVTAAAACRSRTCAAVRPRSVNSVL